MGERTASHSATDGTNPFLWFSAEAGSSERFWSSFSRAFGYPFHHETHVLMPVEDRRIYQFHGAKCGAIKVRGGPDESHPIPRYAQWDESHHPTPWDSWFGHQLCKLQCPAVAAPLPLWKKGFLLRSRLSQLRFARGSTPATRPRTAQQCRPHMLETLGPSVMDFDQV